VKYVLATSPDLLEQTLLIVGPFALVNIIWFVIRLRGYYKD